MDQMSEFQKMNGSVQVRLLQSLAQLLLGKDQITESSPISHNVSWNIENVYWFQ